MHPVTAVTFTDSVDCRYVLTVLLIAQNKYFVQVLG